MSFSRKQTTQLLWWARAGKGGAGDTFGSCYLYKSGKTPKAIVWKRGQGTSLAEALLVDTPVVHGFRENVVNLVSNEGIVMVDPERGEVTIAKKSASARLVVKLTGVNGVETESDHC